MADADREVAVVRSLVDQQRRAVEQEMRDDAARAAAEKALSTNPAPGKALTQTPQGKPEVVKAKSKPAVPTKADSGVSNMRWEQVTPAETVGRGFDYNLLIAYFVLGSFAAALVGAWLSYS
jgi:cobalamin-dependent methionine synthase I